MKLLEKWLFGLNGPVDEAQARELSHIGSKGLMLSLILNIVILVVSFILDVLQRTIGFQTILIAFMLMIVSGYITVLLNNSLLWPSSSIDPLSLINFDPFYLCFAH